MFGDPDSPGASRRWGAARAVRVERVAHATLAALFVVCAGTFAPAWRAIASELDEGGGRLPLETQDDPPDLSTSITNGTSAAAAVGFGRFTSFQVNVGSTGLNITHDAANEPSLAVDPSNRNHIAVGWRQFDSVNSNFRQAGFGWSTDGGVSWTTGKIDPGLFRSDPVLGFDVEGRFFYASITSNLACSVFQSGNGGQSWSAGVAAYGGDKEWITNDRTGGIGHDQIYENWSTDSNPYAPNTFSRSVDDGATFQSPTAIPSAPIWGTMDVGPDGTLYLVGTNANQDAIYVARSSDARDRTQSPSFTTVLVNLGGTIQTGGPNPVGLLGQLWIAVDRSGGPRNGWVYVLASVKTPTDPLDVMFIRSADGGQTWSAPVRVNDDPPGTRAFQWFGTMSVSPNGRIDAVWNDTRGSTDSTKSALDYSYSVDGGVTWSANEQASPKWDSTIGWPRQNKIGDYYHMISRNDGTDLAWAATFNGEEDVYFLRIPSTVTAASDRVPPLRMSGGRPNPFHGSTIIRFEMPKDGGRAFLAVFDPAGRRVATLVNGFVPGGAGSARWSGVDDAGRVVKSGLYLARLETAGRSETTKLMLLR